MLESVTVTIDITVCQQVAALPEQLQTGTGEEEEQHTWWCSTPGSAASWRLGFGTGSKSSGGPS